MSIVYGVPESEMSGRLECCFGFLCRYMNGSDTDLWRGCIEKMSLAVLGERGMCEDFSPSDEEAMNMYLESVYGVDAWVRYFYSKSKLFNVFEMRVPGLGHLFFLFEEDS